LRDLQTNRSSLRSREVGVLVAHGLAAAPAAGRIPAGVSSPFMTRGSGVERSAGVSSPTAPPPAPGGFRRGWAPSAVANGTSHTGGGPAGFAPPGAAAITPAPSNPAAAAPARPAARPHR
jgi:hypothetical protein